VSQTNYPEHAIVLSAASKFQNVTRPCNVWTQINKTRRRALISRLFFDWIIISTPSIFKYLSSLIFTSIFKYLSSLIFTSILTMVHNRPCAPKNQRVGSVRFRRQPGGRSRGFQSFLLSSPTRFFPPSQQLFCCWFLSRPVGAGVFLKLLWSSGGGRERSDWAQNNRPILQKLTDEIKSHVPMEMVYTRVG
jgi:hypothetical protein